MGVFGGSQPSGNTTSTVTNHSDPWSGIQPQLTQAAADTQSLYNQGLLKSQYFPDSTVSPFAPQQQQAIDLTTQRATNGSPINAANQGMLTDTLNGNYLSPDSNPYLKDTYNQAAQAVQGSVNGAFGQGGRYGSGLNQDTLEKNLNGLATNIYGGNYSNERNNQLKASALGPQAANQDYTDLGALANAGAQVQGQNQANLTDTINRYDFNQRQPSQNIANYIGLLNGVGGQYGTSTGTTTNPYYQNSSANALGMGLGLLGMNAMTGAAAGGFGSTALGSALGLLPWAGLSDIRLKESIKYIGEENGFPIYEFSYKADPEKTRYRGVMAQDVIKTRPDAVYLAVDYGKLGIEFSKVHLSGVI
jgi:hypothetical protein